MQLCELDFDLIGSSGRFICHREAHFGSDGPSSIGIAQPSMLPSLSYSLAADDDSGCRSALR